MKVFIKEQLFVLDYKDEIVDCIFNSDDHNTPGYAYNISIEDSNTGYSNLSFTMPTRIIPDGESEAIHNPKLTYVKPLTKIRYERQVIYTGEDDITVSIPIGYGDTVNYQEVVYHKGDLIDLGDNVENGKFKMDYIIQPLDKKRSGLEVSMTFTAIDYPRFNLSKKKLGSTINENTITRGDWSIYEKKPMSIAGSVQYVQWSTELNNTVFGSATAIPLTWDPSTASGYTMTEDQIAVLLKKTEVWTYGVTATIFYWPISNSGRYEGVLYDKGDYLTLNLYEKNLVDVLGSGAVLTDDENYTLVKYTWVEDASTTPSTYKYIKSVSISDHEYLIYELNQVGTEQYLGSIDASTTTTPPTASAVGDWYIAKTPVRVSLDFYGYTWGYYDQGKPYLTPNNPCNYLNWTLENTNWTIKLRTDKRYRGTYWSTSELPASAQEDDYAMIKSIKSDEVLSEDGRAIYRGKYATKALLDAVTGNNTDNWAIVCDNQTTNIYRWDGESWYLSRDGLSKLDTKYYEYTTQWTETTAMWTSSIDKETGVLYDVDQMDTEVAKPDSSTGDLFETTQLRSSLSASDSNCYNIITELCKSFQLYPVFDCINRTVALRMFCGKNFGLTYKLGKSLENTSVKEDGEKVITKLRCYGGTDAQGSEAINLGDANRQYTKTFTGYYTGSGTDVPPTVGVEGFIAIVDPDLDTTKPWITHDNRVVKYLNGSTWANATDNGDGTWSFTLNNVDYLIDEQTGMFAPWSPNDDQYIQARSPYGTEYIYNFKWMYDNGWMTKEDILSLYQKSLEIQELNKSFLDTYTEDYKYGYEMSVKAGVDYQTNQDEYLACINSMMDTYYINPASPSDGTFNAFYQKPNDARAGGVLAGENSNWYYLDMYHCYACGYTSHEAFGTKTISGETVYVCPNCQGYADTKHLSIRIPVWSDYTSAGTTSDVTNPKSKGFYREVIKDVGDTLGTAYINVGSQIPTAPIEGTPGNQLKFILGTETIYDKSSHMYNWNDYVAKWQEYYGLQLDNLVLMNKYIDICEELEEQYNRYSKALNDLENYIQDNWGDYLVEGKYKDETICYTNILLAKSLEASDEYCIPKVTYTASVVDSSGLIEYRIPMAETYNELVHSLHNVGQIVPKAGDYTSLVDEQLGLYGVPAVITSIKRSLDNPQSNSITVDTSYTDDEELVGNIITATNTVLNNSDIYARTAVIKADGTIESASLNKSLEQNNGDNLTFVGTKGSSLLDSTGLVVTDQGNAKRKMRYAGNGIFGTADNGTTWQAMMTPNGINANYIYAGSIDTKYVQIMSGQSAKVVLDNLGLAVKDNVAQSYHLPTTTDIDSDGFDDWTDTNLKAFIGVNNDNDAKLYINGQMNITGGSKVAGWKITSDRLYSGSGSTYVGLCTSGNYRIWAGNSTASSAPFSVTAAGALKSTSGLIGGWNINADTLESASSGAKTILRSNLPEDTTHAIDINNGTFYVQKNGVMKATGANVSGTITTDNLTATGGSITNLSATNLTATGGTFTNITVNGSSTFSGTLNGASGSFSGTGSITGTLYTGTSSNGWIITSDYIKNRGTDSNGGRANIFANGTLAFYPNVNNATGGTFLLNNGARISMSSGVAISSSSNGQVSPSSGNLDLKACSGYTLYLGCMGNTDGTSEQAAISLTPSVLSIKNNGSTGSIEQSAYNMRFNCSGLSISKTQAGDRHDTQTGWVEIYDLDSISLDHLWLCFYHGILVGIAEHEPSNLDQISKTSFSS